MFFYSYCPCRMLESELSRLRYRDPVKSCELPEEDIVFDETGILQISLLNTDAIFAFLELCSIGDIGVLMFVFGGLRVCMCAHIHIQKYVPQKTTLGLMEEQRFTCVLITGISSPA